MKILSLKNIAFDRIYESFSQAFADYELQLNRQELQTMLKRRGFDPAMSFAAFHENQIAAFTLNGTGSFNATPTAYDTGTGTIMKFRGQGLATKIFEHSIPRLVQKGIRQYLLEVLQHNTKALSVYTKLGFTITREFNYYKQFNEEVHVGQKTFYANVKQTKMVFPQLISGFWDFSPSWQNSFDAIKRNPGSFIMLKAFTANILTGYCVFEPASGDITQIAVHENHRGKGIGSALLAEAVKLNKSKVIRMINTDSTCASVKAFMKAKNIPLKGQQFEMIKIIQ